MKYFEVLNDARVWEDAGGIHKMGWLRTGDQIGPIEEYHSWLRFDDNVVGGADLEPLSAEYSERWVSRDDVRLGEIVQKPVQSWLQRLVARLLAWLRGLFQ